ATSTGEPTSPPASSIAQVADHRGLEEEREAASWNSGRRQEWMTMWRPPAKSDSEQSSAQEHASDAGFADEFAPESRVENREHQQQQLVPPQSQQ
ncbi:hypothetical protein PF002_g33624, partial [Phytophthora fragariae]